MITLYHQGIGRQRFTKTKQQDHNNAIQKSVSQESTKHNAETKAPPSQEPRDHRGRAARATCSQIHGYDPKASDDAFMWLMENGKRGGETNSENGSKLKRQRNYRR